MRKISKILCIDDHIQGLAARRIVLEDKGFEVIVARNGRDGLEAFRKAKVDAIVVDYVMPHMNGGEVIREIRKTHPRIPIILLSAYAETMDLEEKITEAEGAIGELVRHLKTSQGTGSVRDTRGALVR